jgi:hypothetical protein
LNQCSDRHRKRNRKIGHDRLPGGWACLSSRACFSCFLLVKSAPFGCDLGMIFVFWGKKAFCINLGTPGPDWGEGSAGAPQVGNFDAD